MAYQTPKHFNTLCCFSFQLTISDQEALSRVVVLRHFLKPQDKYKHESKGITGLLNLSVLYTFVQVRENKRQQPQSNGAALVHCK